jgi:hypothetical protein
MNKLEKSVNEKIKEEKIDQISKIVFTIILIICATFIIRGLSLLNDETILVFECASSKEMGATVKLKPASRFNKDQTSNALYGFARSYILCAFPRNIGMAKQCYEYIVRHTKDKNTKRKYSAFLNDEKVLNTRYQQGMVDEFSPKSSNEYILEKLNGTNTWVFEIDGFLNKRKSTIDEDRGVVKLRLTISFSDAEESGSYTGFYVQKFEILHLKNIVTGEFRDVLKN